MPVNPPSSNPNASGNSASAPISNASRTAVTNAPPTHPVPTIPGFPPASTYKPPAPNTNSPKPEKIDLFIQTFYLAIVDPQNPHASFGDQGVVNVHNMDSLGEKMRRMDIRLANVSFERVNFVYRLVTYGFEVSHGTETSSFRCKHKLFAPGHVEDLLKIRSSVPESAILTTPLHLSEGARIASLLFNRASGDSQSTDAPTTQQLIPNHMQTEHAQRLEKLEERFIIMNAAVSRNTDVTDSYTDSLNKTTRAFQEKYLTINRHFARVKRRRGKIRTKLGQLRRMFERGFEQN